MRCAEPTPAQWAALDEALGAQVRFAAGLLAGEVPPELEDVCAEAGFSLFPTTWADLRATCSCPDWENPCKHIASVLYVFADQLDGDPWLLLEWHGRSRDDLLAFLGASTDDDPNGRDGLPVWWPLTPGRLPQVTGAFQPRLSPTPDPPDRVLARLGPLDVEAVGAQVDELLADAYAAIIADPPTGTQDERLDGPGLSVPGLRLEPGRRRAVPLRRGDRRPRRRRARDHTGVAPTVSGPLHPLGRIGGHDRPRPGRTGDRPGLAARPGLVDRRRGR